MERSIQDVAKLAGRTSRTLRHYDEIGLLPPSRWGSNGYRWYDEDALARLQRILLLRDLGLGLPAIAEALNGHTAHVDALEDHLGLLKQEKQRLDRQLASVECTILRMKKGEPLMAEEMFDGFDHTRYKDEVEERWGGDAYASGDRWWRSKSAAEKRDWTRRMQQLASDWTRAASRGADPKSEEAQQLAQRQFDWFAAIPGTPGAGSTGPTKGYFVGLAEMYATDPRFGANYGGQDGAEFVRNAMTVHAEREL